MPTGNIRRDLRRLQRLLLALCLALCLVPPLAVAQDAAPTSASAAGPNHGLQPVHTIANVREYRLANGLQLLLMAVPESAVVQVTVTYRVGSRHEGPGESGMAHLLEHMTYRGTRQLPDLSNELSRLAVSYNGSTAVDRTNYFGSFRPDAAVLHRVLQLEAARMTEARLDDADLRREKAVVLNEMGLRNAPTSRQLGYALAAASFREHPYGRPVLGSAQDIEQIALPALRSFYERHYRPDNAVLMIAGAFEAAPTLAAVEAIFGPLRGASAAVPVSSFAAEPDQRGPRTLTVRTSQSGLAVGWRVPGMAHPDAPALAVTMAALASISTAWWQQQDRAAQLLPLNPMLDTREPCVLGLMATLPGQRSQDRAARDALVALQDRWLEMIDRTAQRNDGFTSLVRTAAQGLGTSARKQLGDPVTASALVSSAVGAGDWRLAFRMPAALAAVGIDDVLRVKARYLEARQRIVVRGVTDATLTGPEFVEAEPGLLDRLFGSKADVQAVADASQGLDTLQLDARPGGAAFDADPAAIEARVQRLRLPGGARLALLPKDSPDGSVIAVIELRWGASRDLATQQPWLGLAGVAQRATSLRSAGAMLTLQQALPAAFRVQTSAQSVRVEVTTREQQLPRALALAKEFLSRPSLTGADIDVDRKPGAARLLAAEPAGSAWGAQRRHINLQRRALPGMPGYLHSPIELAQTWLALDADRVRDFHRRSWSANDARIAIVGHVPDRAAETVEALFGSWKNPEAAAYAPAAELHLPVAGARFVSTAVDATAASVNLLQEIPLARGDELEVPLRVGVQILASAAGSAGTRLGERLRRQDAFSYTIHAEVVTPVHGNRSRVVIGATAAPQSSARVEAAIREELARLLNDGVAAEEVDVAQRQLLETRRLQRGDDRLLAQALLAHFDSDGGFIGNEARDDAALRTVTPERVQAALRQLLQPDRWITVVIGAPPGNAPR